MKISKLTAALAAGIMLCPLAACSNDDDSVDLSDYESWRKENIEWLTELQTKTNADGTPYYEVVVPKWNPGIFVLMHFFNDRSTTEGNLTPLYTSTVDVIYDAYTKDGTLFDTSAEVTSYGRKGVQRFTCNYTIQGWSVAMEQMRVGDTCEVVVPADAAYGSAMTGTLNPYSAIRFNMRLVDIYKYEAPDR